VSLLRVPFNAGVALALMLLSACASTPAVPSPAPGPTVPRPVPPAEPTTLPRPTSFVYLDSDHTYDIQETTVLAIRGDSIALPVLDTVSMRALVAYQVRQGETTPSITARVDSLTIRSSRDTSMALRHLDTTVLVSFQLDSGRTFLPSVPTDASSCDSMREIAEATVRNTLARIPRTLTIGDTWTDSVTTALCRGSIPMISMVQSVYRIQDIRDSVGISLLRITRASRLLLSGSGLQNGRQVTVRGQGQSETLQTYDISNGAFLESDGYSSMELTFQTLRQRELVHQQSVSRIRRRS
jgi:hypothetical protein